MTKTVEDNLRLLGLRVQDKVTAFKGVVSSIGFDLYGCVQAVVTPAAGENGKIEDSRWFDTSRLDVLDETPVMDLPAFLVVTKPAAAVHGGFEKSVPRGI